MWPILEFRKLYNTTEENAAFYGKQAAEKFVQEGPLDYCLRYHITIARYYRDHPKECSTKRLNMLLGALEVLEPEYIRRHGVTLEKLY